MANDPQTQDQQVDTRPGQTAPVPLPEGLQPNTPVPSEFSGWNKIYVKQGEAVPPGWTNLSAGSPTHTMLTANGDNTYEVPVSQMQDARSKGSHVAIPMQAPAPDNRDGWIPLHNATAALKAGFQHVGHYKQAMDDALSAVRDKRNDIATAAADAIARHTPNYDLMPPEVQNDLKEMVGMGVGFFTGGAMQPGMSSEEAKAASSVKTPLTSTIPPVGLGGTSIEPSEPAMQLGRVPEKPIPAERQLAGEPVPRTLEAKAVEPGVYAATPAVEAKPVEANAAIKVPEFNDPDEAIKHYEGRYKEVQEGDTVSGMKVRGQVDNMSSIAASIPNYEILDGLREVSMGDFPAPPVVNKRTQALAQEIKNSGEITPLIVGFDDRGPFILEGSHRYDALKINGAKSFPAVVVADRDEFGPRSGPSAEAKTALPEAAGVKVPPEQSTGRPEWDEAIKKGGAIPGGFQKGAPEEGIPNYAQFHDPQTGSSLLLPEDQVTPENVATHLAESRAKYAAAAQPEETAEPTEENLLMAEKQSPLRQPYTIEVTNPNEETHRETIQAFSVEDARRTITKQFPDAKSFRLESYAERTPSTDYVVPTDKILSMPELPLGRLPEDVMRHELGHAMIGQKEGMTPIGMLRHTAPGMSNSLAAVSWNANSLYGPNRKILPEKAPGVIRSAMAGIAADELRGTPRSANYNLDPANKGTDGFRAMKILKSLGYDSSRAMEIMHRAIDVNKEYLSNPAVKSVIDENVGVREPNLSRQFHYSSERLSNMHAEAQRRIQSGKATEPNNGAINGEGSTGLAGNVSGQESVSTSSAGQSVPAQASLPFGSSPEAAPAIAAAPSVQGLHPQAQDWAGTVQKIAAKMGKDAAIEAGRRILGSARLDPNAANRPEIAHLNDWLNKWESTVSPKELEARMNMLEVNPLKIIQGTGENPKNAEQAATAAGVKDPKDLSDISSSTKKNLLSVNADAKTVKGQKKGYMTGILYLAPDTTSGIANTCPFATEGCRKACLFTAGRAGIFPAINEARTSKTRFFKFDKDGFMNNLSKNVGALVRKADREGYTPAVRLNGTSDLPWENVKGAEGKTIMEQYPNVQFYDYTKNPSRMDQYLKGGMPKNYHLTFSRSETNDAAAMQILKDGGNAAVVFDTKRGKPLPTEWNGFKVIDGDETDVRFLDDKSTVIGLRAKGKAKKDTTGFVLNVKTPGTK